MTVIAEAGRPVPQVMRPEKSIDHWLHYGLKMLIRTDFGGRNKVAAARELVQRITCRDVEDRPRVLLDIIGEQISACQNRIRHTIQDLKSRASHTHTAANYIHSEAMRLKESPVIDHESLAKIADMAQKIMDLQDGTE